MTEARNSASASVKPATTIKHDERIYDAPNVTASLAKLRGDAAASLTSEQPAKADAAAASPTSRAPEPSAARTPGTGGPRPDQREQEGGAAAAFLRADVRSRKVVLEELLRDFTLGDSDATRCVKMAAAKLAYQVVHPDTQHGKGAKGQRGKDAKSASLRFEKYAAKKVGGWKPRTITRWCMIGEGLDDAAYQALLGTSLATNMGHLEKLCRLAAPGQLDVATKFMLKLEREGRDQLEQLSRQLDSHEARAAALPTESPPSGERYVEVLKSTGQPVCILHGHIIEVADLPDRTGLSFLGTVPPGSRVEQVATENWIDAVRDAAAEIQANFGGVYTLELSPIRHIFPSARDHAHHLVAMTARHTLQPGAGGDVVLYVTRWDSAAAGKMYFGDGYAYDPYRTKLPVVAVNADPARTRVPVPYDWSRAVKKEIVDTFWSERGWRRSIRRQRSEEAYNAFVAEKEARRERGRFRWSAWRWFLRSARVATAA